MSVYPSHLYEELVVSHFSNALEAVQDDDLDVALDHIGKAGETVRKEREVRVLEAAAAKPPACECRGGLVAAPWEDDAHYLGRPCSKWPRHSGKMEHISAPLGRVLARVAPR
jgi:hypothetical protein